MIVMTKSDEKNGIRFKFCRSFIGFCFVFAAISMGFLSFLICGLVGLG